MKNNRRGFFKSLAVLAVGAAVGQTARATTYGEPGPMGLMGPIGPPGVEGWVPNPEWVNAPGRIYFLNHEGALTCYDL